MEEANKHVHRFHAMRVVDEETISAIEKNKDIFKGKTGVDLGAGGGTFSKILSKYTKMLYCADVSEEAIKALNENFKDVENIKVVKVPSNNLPFKDSEVDFVFTANSFHDMPKGYEKEISRIIKKGGAYIDLDFKKTETQFGPPMSIRLSEDEVKGKFAKASFDFIKSQTIKDHYLLIFLKIRE
jgi:ubiquinone/menaquinone biosynthesis C-methylase UbiE